MLPRRLKLRLLLLLAPVPALGLGAAVMRHHHVPTVFWTQNLWVGTAMGVVCFAHQMICDQHAAMRQFRITGLVGIVTLISTFLDPGLHGVHRWIQLGPIRLYAAAIFLPMIITLLGFLVERGSIRAAILLMGCTVAVLAAQPDAAQTTAFAVATFAIAFCRFRRNWLLWPVAFALVGISMWAWLRPDPLPRIPYVEGILDLVGDQGVLWYASGLAILFALPAPFLSGSPSKTGASTAWALGFYFCTCLLASFLGNFPVPLLAYGASPIIGYFLALDWLISQGEAAAIMASGSTHKMVLANITQPPASPARPP